jgi:DDE superfamily endonuclease
MHKTAAIQCWMVRHPRFHVHFTPTSASWLNQVERFFAALTEKQIRRNSFRSTRQLEAAIETTSTTTTNNQSPSWGHYTKRQESYGKTSLHKPVAIVEPIAIPFRKPKGGDLGSDRGSCANVRLRNAANVYGAVDRSGRLPLLFLRP